MARAYDYVYEGAIFPFTLGRACSDAFRVPFPGLPGFGTAVVVALSFEAILFGTIYAALGPRWLGFLWMQLAIPLIELATRRNALPTVFARTLRHRAWSRRRNAAIQVDASSASLSNGPSPSASLP